MIFKINVQCPYCGMSDTRNVTITETEGNHLFKFTCDCDDNSGCGLPFIVQVDLVAITTSYKNINIKGIESSQEIPEQNLDELDKRMGVA